MSRNLCSHCGHELPNDTGTYCPRCGQPRANGGTYKTRMAFGIILPFSEVCMYMKVAGKVADVEYLPHNMAQIYIDGRAFSMPVTRGEAGVAYDR